MLGVFLCWMFLCWVVFMLSVFMLGVFYTECFYAEWSLCWLWQIQLFCWVFLCQMSLCWVLCCQKLIPGWLIEIFSPAKDKHSSLLRPWDFYKIGPMFWEHFWFPYFNKNVWYYFSAKSAIGSSHILCFLILIISIQPGNPYWRGRLSTVDPLRLTSLNQLLLI